MTHQYIIASWLVSIVFKNEDDVTGVHLIPSMSAFEVDDAENVERLFTLYVDDSLRPVSKERRRRIRVFDTGNGDTVVDRIDDGGYQYLIRDIHGADCALLIANADFTECRCALAGDSARRCFGMNNVLMLSYAFAGSFRSTLLIHASLVRHRGYAYAFIAKSGTGKSTQVANWLRMIPDCDLMNDDNPIVRVHGDGNVLIYGSPWSGKTPCYRDVAAPLVAITRIDRADENTVERMRPLKAFSSFLPSCSAMKWEKELYSRICDTVTAVVTNVPVYTLHCTADPESAVVCHKQIAYGD